MCQWDKVCYFPIVLFSLASRAPYIPKIYMAFISQKIWPLIGHIVGSLINDLSLETRLIELCRCYMCIVEINNVLCKLIKSLIIYILVLLML